MEANSSFQMIALTRVDSLMNMLSTFSTILLGVFGALALILGFLVWKQNEMRKAAEKEMEKISSISEKMGGLYRLHSELIRKDKEMLTAARELMEGTIKKSKEIDKLMKKMEKTGKEVVETRSRIGRIRAEMENEVKSLATISRMMPEEKTEPRTLRDLVKDLDKIMYSPEVIDQALRQEAMRRRAEYTGKKEK